MTALFFYLVWAHCLADYPLQGDFLARAKDRHNKSMAMVPWQVALGAHAMIHAGFVAALTGSILLGLAEFVAHVAIDFSKCEKYFGGWTRTFVLNPYDPGHTAPEKRAFWIDQALHIACKAVWTLAVMLAATI